MLVSIELLSPKVSHTDARRMTSMRPGDLGTLCDWTLSAGSSVSRGEALV
jgi:hypothetical protein